MSHDDVCAVFPQKKSFSTIIIVDEGVHSRYQRYAVGVLFWQFFVTLYIVLWHIWRVVIIFTHWIIYFHIQNISLYLRALPCSGLSPAKAPRTGRMYIIHWKSLETTKNFWAQLLNEHYCTNRKVAGRIYLPFPSPFPHMRLLTTHEDVQARESGICSKSIIIIAENQRNSSPSLI